MKRILSIISMFLIILTLLPSCSEPDGLNIGFNGIWVGLLPNVHFGVRSERSEFAIDDVTLDFSYGNGSSADVGGYIGDPNGGEDWPIVCVAVYFYNARHEDKTVGFGEYCFEDYKNIEGLYFVKEIGLDDYNENYDVDNNFFRRKYEHTETLTMPEGVFELTTGYVCMGVYEIAYSPSEKLYRFVGGGRLGLKYEVLEDGSVKIGEAGSTVLGDPK